MTNLALKNAIFHSGKVRFHKYLAISQVSFFIQFLPCWDSLLTSIWNFVSLFLFWVVSLVHTVKKLGMVQKIHTMPASALQSISKGREKLKISRVGLTGQNWLFSQRFRLVSKIFCTLMNNMLNNIFCNYTNDSW